MSYFGWLFDPANWTGSGGIPARLVEHLGYVALAMIIALVIALPLGAWVGHTGRGGFLVVGSANALRALPTLGVLILLVTPFGLSIVGPLIALVVLAIPPLLAGTYAGVRNVDPAVVDAARGMGMSRSEIQRGVEIPIATPVIFAGIRTAAVQVVSGAVLAAYIGGGGLGDFITAGIAMMALPQLFVGAIPATLLSIGTDQLFGYLQRTFTPPGLRAA